jgi:hypothetical protein
MKNKQMAKWETVRAKGMLWYIITRGLFLAVSVPVGSALVRRFLRAADHLELTWLELIVFVIVGFGWAFVTWYSCEAQYKQARGSTLGNEPAQLPCEKQSSHSPSSPSKGSIADRRDGPLP